MAEEIPTDKTIRHACLIESMHAMFAEELDFVKDKDIEVSFVSRYDPNGLSASDPWRVKPYENWRISSVCYWPSRDLRCVLSREGDTRIYGLGGTPDHLGNIKPAGVFQPNALGFGYVNQIKAVDRGLYVCGQSRQVYRFYPGDERTLTGQWHDIAGAMRQSPISAPPEGDDAAAFDAWLDSNNAVDFVDLGGSAEDDLYCVGDEAWHWDGKTWRQLQLPTDEPLAAIEVLNQDTVLLAGRNGTLLKGSAQHGFTQLTPPPPGVHFTGIALFNRQLFLPSNQGMFVYDPEQAQLLAYASGLQPELQDCHLVEAKDGVLWSFGFKDLAWFDGVRWTRIQHPDNQPIA